MHTFCTVYRNLDCCKKFESICPIHHHLCKRKCGDGGVERALSFFLHQHWKINLVSAVGREMLLCLQLYVLCSSGEGYTTLPSSNYREGNATLSSASSEEAYVTLPSSNNRKGNITLS